MSPSSISPFIELDPSNAITKQCYHCGELVPVGVDFSVNIAGDSQPMCCPGCRAVASMIASTGMSNFYRQRTAFNLRPEVCDIGLSPADSNRYKIYDYRELSSTFTEKLADGLSQSQLLLGGMTCAACTWLIEHSLLAMPGVKTANVHLGKSRLDVGFLDDETQFSDIFERVEALGYTVRPFHISAQREQLSNDYRTSLKRLAVAGLGMMQVGMFAIALHAGDIQGMQPQYQVLLRWVSLLVSTFVVLYSGRSFFLAAWRHLKIGALVMDLPVALAIGIAWLASTWATLSDTGQVYFDSVVMFIFFLLLARLLEQRVRQNGANTWFNLEESLPAVVAVRGADEWLTTLREKIAGGEVVLLKPGETIAVDAQILKGESAIEESAFNGESIPRRVSPSDIVYAGTVNIESSLEARALGSYRQSRLALLQHAIQRGESEKPRLMKLADRIASRFVGAILIVTAITALYWFNTDTERALWISLSVLVISCPCALALATPAALTAAANSLRSNGVIVRGENALESLSRITHFVFDKTGTLTQARLDIEAVQCLSILPEDEVLALAAALQQHANHPLARAFDNISATRAFANPKYHLGAGLVGQLDGASYRLGSEKFCRAIAVDLPPPPPDPLYWIALCEGSTPLAWIGLSDLPRAEAMSVVSDALASGLSVELLTGDASQRGTSLAKSLAIETVHLGMEPQQKMEYIAALQKTGAVVAMVGDGLNDAPVLSVANASFAVSDATDLAKTKADFVIVEKNLHAVLDTWRKAVQCRRIIIQNFAWALTYNLCAIPLAAFGFVPPWAAAIGMSLSSLLVVLNSLRLNFSTST
jgi:Cu2+-exporting ATPase